MTELRVQKVGYKKSNDLVARFNACCDMINAEEKKAMDEGRMQEWLDFQDKLWTQVKTQHKRWLDLMVGSRAPVQTARILDKFKHVIRAFTQEKKTDAQIFLDAQGVLDGRNAEDTWGGAGCIVAE